MNKFFVLVFFAFSISVFSQTEPIKFKDKFDEFQYYAKPNKTNNLSKYFKRNIDYTLLEGYKFKDTLRKNSIVVITFRLNKNKKIISSHVNSPYSELNVVIKKAFEAYDLEQIELPDLNPLNLYSLQILSREGDKIVVNCSSIIVYDRLPIFEGCESGNSYYNNKHSFRQFLEQHLVKNISVDFLEKRKVIGSMFLEPEFFVTEEGTIEKVNWKTATDSLTLETNRIMALFPKAKTPATRNGNPSRIYIKERIELVVQSNNEEYIENAIHSNNSNLNPNCELALHFKSHITEEEIYKFKLPIYNSKVYINFSFDKKGNLINIKSNVRNQELDEKLVAIFKKFPKQNLNIQQFSVLEEYQYTICTLENKNKVVIHCNEHPEIFVEAFFDKKCEKSKSPKDLRQRIQENVRSKIINNFNSSIIPPEDYYKGVRLFFNFEVDIDGTIKRINENSVNPKYSREIDNIIEQMPKVYKPAYFNGKPIKRKYTIPISFGMPIILDKY